MFCANDSDRDQTKNNCLIIAHSKISSKTHMASEIMTKTHLGIFAKTVATVMKLHANVYIVGAQALGIVRARRTVRNLPKPPSGDKIAAMRPPTLLPLSNPASHAGTFAAQAANTAPRQ